MEIKPSRERGESKLTVAGSLVAEFPVQRFTITLLAEIVREGVAAQETNEAVQLANTILKRCAGETPSVFCLELERGLRGVRRSLLDIVSFIELLCKR